MTNLTNLTNLRRGTWSSWSSWSSKKMEVVLLILQGKTLMEFGEKYKLTRERVRQIWEKTVEKMPESERKAWMM